MTYGCGGPPGQSEFCPEGTSTPRDNSAFANLLVIENPNRSNCNIAQFVSPSATSVPGATNPMCCCNAATSESGGCSSPWMGTGSRDAPTPSPSLKDEALYDQPFTGRRTHSSFEVTLSGKGTLDQRVAAIEAQRSCKGLGAALAEDRRRIACDNQRCPQPCKLRRTRFRWGIRN